MPVFFMYGTVMAQLLNAEPKTTFPVSTLSAHFSLSSSGRSFRDLLVDLVHDVGEALLHLLGRDLELVDEPVDLVDEQYRVDPSP